METKNNKKSKYTLPSEDFKAFGESCLLDLKEKNEQERKNNTIPKLKIIDKGTKGGWEIMLDNYKVHGIKKYSLDRETNNPIATLKLELYCDMGLLDIKKVNPKD